MQNNENHPNRRRIRNFFREKGYYIVLGLCVCAVGVSGWLFVSNAVSEKRSLQSETLSIATSAEDPQAGKSSGGKTAPTTAPAAEETAPAAAMTDDTVREAAASVRVWPVSGEAQAAYSVDALQYNATTQDWRTHAGVDLTAAVGTPVRAAGSGVVTAVPMLFYAIGVRNLPLMTTGICQYLSPTLAIFCGMIMGESLTREKLVSFCFIWAGVILYTLNSIYEEKKRNKTAA